MFSSRLSDGDVVRAVLDGQSDTFVVLVRRYQDVLFAHAYRMVRGHDEAADLVQRAFVNGYGKLSACREPEKVGGWLFRILSNLCRDHLRGRRRREVSIDDVPLPAPSAETPERSTQRSELRERLNEALNALEPDLREAFVLKHVDGRSYKEMSALLDASVPALKMRVHRARDELQQRMGAFR